ncbi:pimeloyl-ACP methyl ester carboxylesterase [Sphingopyxis sp. OAS728]|uniref:alpha/beta fold hydrolase n=1 Tax=Sphingopyxis sp. OAS728 TaxID=2663823 RepID=UPI00178ADB1A|nr:alpha/beta hydrolase [Sphingopyxis sp. OAS728]MBE1528951.1 pimeloyl-ACP methyl ester carboxylesterase [Sphingopyxis sp. OAS728]
MRHGTIEVQSIPIFYREAGPPDGSVLLLPHGYPGSSFQFRQLMPALADRWHTIAFDFPGFGYSGTPDRKQFAYDFNGYAEILRGVADHFELERYALWLHDYGSQIGLRHAIACPDRITGLVIQNGDIYEDALGPKYAAIKAYWADKSRARLQQLEAAVSEKGFREEFVGEVADAVATRVPPDLWKLHWPLMNTPVRRRVVVELMKGLEANLSWFPRYQAYLRDHQPRALILWGPEDGYMPAEAGEAYRRDLPNADLHLIDGAGHWLLETHFEQALPLVREFLNRLDA